MWVQAGRLPLCVTFKEENLDFSHIQKPAGYGQRSAWCSSIIVRTLFWIVYSRLLSLLGADKTRFLAYFFFIRPLIPFRRMPPLWANYLLKDSRLPISTPPNQIWQINLAVNNGNSPSIEYIQFICAIISVLVCTKRSGKSITLYISHFGMCCPVHVGGICAIWL